MRDNRERRENAERGNWECMVQHTIGGALWAHTLLYCHPEQGGRSEML